MRAGARLSEREQEADGSWFGRWGVNYIYGTWSVLCALNAAGVDPRSRPMRKAVAWLIAIQNADGGWGEDCASYGSIIAATKPRHPRVANRLGAAGADGGGRGRHPAVARGIACCGEPRTPTAYGGRMLYRRRFPAGLLPALSRLPEILPAVGDGAYRNLMRANTGAGLRHVTILAVTGLHATAGARGPGVEVVAGGGDQARLEASSRRLRPAWTASSASASPARWRRDCGRAIGRRTRRSRGKRGDADRSALDRSRSPLAASSRARACCSAATTSPHCGAKPTLHRTTGALAVDMESHVAARIAARHGLPFAAGRVISDRRMNASAGRARRHATGRQDRPAGRPAIAAARSQAARRR